MSKAVIEKQ